MSAEGWDVRRVPSLDADEAACRGGHRHADLPTLRTATGDAGPEGSVRNVDHSPVLFPDQSV